jgi:hypothetical protein
MKRLRESYDSPDHETRRAARLIAGVRALEPDAAREMRVRRRIRSAPTARGLPLTRLAWILVVLLAAVTATATTDRVWRKVRPYAFLQRTDAAQEGHRPDNGRAESQPSAPRAASVGVGASGTAAADPGSGKVEAAGEEFTPEVAETNGHDRRTDAERRVPSRRKDATVKALPIASAPEQASAAPSTPAAPGPETLLMMQAMQARSSGDLARAAQLLAEYRARFPNGELLEEALALSIEAEASRGSATATDLARTYLTKFPNGRFRGRVDRALRTMGR